MGLLRLQPCAPVAVYCQWERAPVDVRSFTLHRTPGTIMLEATQCGHSALNGDGSLFDAARAGDTALVQQLLDSGANVDGEEGSEIPPVFIASWLGHVDIVDLLLQHGADVNRSGSFDGRCAVHVASLMGHSTVLEMLLQHGADVNRCDLAGNSALYECCKQGRHAIARLLLKYGARNDPHERYGKTPADVALERGHVELFQLIAGDGF